MNTERTRTAADDRLNELYWGSDKTVDEIVSESGIGRNSLYLSVLPAEAGADCAQCGKPLYFSNRTQRAAGAAACLACGFTTTIAGDGAGDGPDGGSRRKKLQAGLRAVASERAAMIGGAAALGLVVGATATRAIRD